MCYKYDRNQRADENETKETNFDSIEILDPKISENLDLTEMQSFAHKVDTTANPERRESLLFHTAFSSSNASSRKGTVTSGATP
jgi:hypothetical protein